MTIAIVAILAVALGCLVLATVQLAIIISQLGDLKAYVMTQISILQSIDATTSTKQRDLFMRIHKVVKLCQRIR